MACTRHTVSQAKLEQNIQQMALKFRFGLAKSSIVGNLPDSAKEVIDMDSPSARLDPYRVNNQLLLRQYHWH